MPGVITLTTDFGLQDHYVAVMKAVMMRLAPGVTFVDISHTIPPQDVMAGAWVLRNAAMMFPKGTVHLAVIDPGVGTDRKPVALEMNGHFFVGPDNGLFTLIGEQYDATAVELAVGSATESDPPSQTFHGRDIFAPAAARLASGVPLHELGTPFNRLVTYHWATPISDKDGIQGWVVHIDSYGNLITNIPGEMLDRMLPSGENKASWEYKTTGESKTSREYKIYVGNTILPSVSRTFGSVPEGDPVAYIGSAGMLEIAVNKGNASELLSVLKGAQVTLIAR